VLERIRGIESTGDDRPTLYPPPLRRALPDGLGLRRFPALVFGCLRDYRQLSACYRPPRSGNEQHRLRFESWGLDHPASSVRALARRLGATVQDVAFAALFQELGRLYPEEQRFSSRRSQLALAAAVDLRKHLKPELANAMGQWVASYSVTHPVPDDAPLERIVADVAAQTTRTKRRRLYFSHILSLAVVSSVWPLLSTRQKERSASRLPPVLAAFSNLNLSGILGDAGVGRYLRAASTGPLVPLLVDFTTVGDRLSVTSICREGTLEAERIDGLMSGLTGRLFA
jgi:hypothetical protein